jgi:hypothetical protein
LSDNFCADGGLLVGTKFPIPEDPHQFYRDGGDVIGCNRVYCSRCKSWVKHIDQQRIWKRRLEPVDHEKLYESLDPKLFDVFFPERLFRTYLCRCNWADTPSLKQLGFGDIDGWDCAGHSVG